MTEKNGAGDYVRKPLSQHVKRQSTSQTGKKSEASPEYGPRNSDTSHQRPKNGGGLSLSHLPTETGVESFAITTFPWIVLSVNDSQVLRRQAHTLLSDDVRDATDVCHLLNDVLFHDFPAEIFLQRPSVLQALCALVESKRAPLPKESFGCLETLTGKFVIRFRQVSLVRRSDSDNLDCHNSADCSMSLPAVHSFPRSSFSSVWNSASSSARSGDSSECARYGPLFSDFHRYESSSRVALSCSYP